jgi:hypothetical protein
VTPSDCGVQDHDLRPFAFRRGWALVGPSALQAVLPSRYCGFDSHPHRTTLQHYYYYDYHNNTNNTVCLTVCQQISLPNNVADVARVQRFSHFQRTFAPLPLPTSVQSGRTPGVYRGKRCQTAWAGRIHFERRIPTKPRNNPPRPGRHLFPRPGLPLDTLSWRWYKLWRPDGRSRPPTVE